jgi:GT2 family glycosyltransferase
MLDRANKTEGRCILVLCISYGNDDDTISFARALKTNETYEGLRITVVDNSGSSTLRKALSQISKETDLRVLVSESNLGYFGGAALGFRDYLLWNEMPEWIIVCNSDISLLQEDFFGSLLHYGDKHNFGIISPSIISGLSGKDQNPFMLVRPSASLMGIYKVLFTSYPSVVLYSSLYLAKEKLLKLYWSRLAISEKLRRAAEPVRIYAGHGAFLAFRKTYFERGGTLHHGAFLFGEEIFVAETVRRLGLTIGYDPRLQVFHRGHATTGYIPSRVMVSHMREAARYCADTWFSE